MIEEIGTIDYETGKVRIENIRIDSYYGDSINIYVLPADPDIMVSQNTILSVEADEIDITVEEIRE